MRAQGSIANPDVNSGELLSTVIVIIIIVIIIIIIIIMNHPCSFFLILRPDTAGKHFGTLLLVRAWCSSSAFGV